MNAVISGTAGRALVIDGESLKSFDVDDPSKLVVRRQSDLPYFFGEGSDLRIIENSDLKSITKELQADSDFAFALDLTLISLDDELEEDIRKDALRDLDELLANPQLRERLEGVFHARPVPDDGDLKSALKFCDEWHLPNSFPFMEMLDRRQSLISKASAAWDVIPAKIFGGYEHQAESLRIAASLGLFRALVITLETQQTVSTFLLRASLNNSISQLRNYRDVLQHWVRPFRDPDEAHAIEYETEEEFGPEISPRRKHGRRIGINRQAMLAEVNRRKGAIVPAIHLRDLETVRALVDDLVEYQQGGEAEHIAKSLCDLAMEAKTSGMFPLQLELTERSISLASDDGWSWAQYADALLNMHKLDAALDAYSQAAAFGAGPIAKRGRGEVLKAKSQLDEALAAFDEVIADDDQDIVAKTGRAEVLKAKGLFDESLAAFDEVIRQHPENVVAKTGRAEVLKAKGLFDESLAAFDEVVRQHPEDVVAKTGRAEVLKAKGVLSAALTAYDEIHKRHLENPIIRNGRSCILAALGRYDEALQELPDKNPAGLEDWIGYHIRGMILMRMNRIEEAVNIFQRGIIKNPFPASAAYFKTALTVALIRQEEYDEASLVLRDINAPSLQPQLDVLRLHLAGERAQFEDANEAFEDLTPKPWSISNELLDELHRRYILKAPPKRSNDWVVDQYEKSLLLVSTQQASVSSYGY